MGAALTKGRLCECGFEWLVMIWKDGTVLNNDRTDDPENLTCPECDSAVFTPTMNTAMPIWLGGDHAVGRHYPHYNRGLGCTVQSHKHYYELCEARGLHPVEGDIDLEKDAMRRDTKHKTALARWARLKDYYKNGPDQDLRKAWGEQDNIKLTTTRTR